MKALRNALIAVTLVAGSPLAAASITAGFNPSIIGSETVELRFRGTSSGGEIFLGENGVGSGANRVEANNNWSAGTYNFLWTFNSLTDTLDYSTGPKSPLSYTLKSPQVAPDVVQMTIRNQSQRTGTFEIRNLTVNGEGVADQGSLSGFNDFMITDFKRLSTLTIAGDLVVAGTFGSNDSERVRVQFSASKNPTLTAPVPLPAALPLMGAGIGLLAALRRRKRA